MFVGLFTMLIPVLCGAGLAMRRQPPVSRAVLVAYGLGQFVLGLSTSRTAWRGFRR